MISLSSPYAMVVYSPDEISVDKGSSFSITCSTVSKYPMGYFYLTRSNKNISEAKQAYGHVLYMATFDFQQIEYVHQGAYTCVFAVNISSEPFYSAPSKLLQVVVTGENLEHSRPFAIVLVLVIDCSCFVLWWHPLSMISRFLQPPLPHRLSLGF